MAIRLSFDIIGSTCGDLLRFADAVRAARTEPDVPLQQTGPNRIDIVDDKGGPGPGPVPPPFAPHRPTLPHFGPFAPPVSGHPMSGSFPPGFGHPSGPSYEPSRPGGTIEVNWGGRSRRTRLSIETVGELHAVLGRALESADLDESVRAALRNLREAFSDHEPPGGP